MTADLLGRAAEQEVFDWLLENVRRPQSAVMVVRGEAGIGKTALLRYAARQASGFHVMQDRGRRGRDGAAVRRDPSAVRSDARPPRPRFRTRSADALRVALGLAAGESPDRFLVALAVLSLLSAVAEERPLLCLVEDAQWLDAASSQILGFVARRLLAEPVAIVFAIREPSDAGGTSTACPSSGSQGLRDEDARALLASAVPGRLDDHVRDRIVAETRGNPLALLELPRAHDRRRAGGRLRASRRGTTCRDTSRSTTCRRVGELPERRRSA